MKSLRYSVFLYLIGGFLGIGSFERPVHAQSSPIVNIRVEFHPNLERFFHGKDNANKIATAVAQAFTAELKATSQSPVFHPGLRPWIFGTSGSRYNLVLKVWEEKPRHYLLQVGLERDNRTGRSPLGKGKWCGPGEEYLDPKCAPKLSVHQGVDKVSSRINEDFAKLFSQEIPGTQSMSYRLVRLLSEEVPVAETVRWPGPARRAATPLRWDAYEFLKNEAWTPYLWCTGHDADPLEFTGKWYSKPLPYSTSSSEYAALGIDLLSQTFEKGPPQGVKGKVCRGENYTERRVFLESRWRIEQWKR